MYKLHSLPKLTLSKKDVRFKNRFWNALHGLLGTSFTMFLVFHPQRVCLEYSVCPNYMSNSK